MNGIGLRLRVALYLSFYFALFAYVGSVFLRADNAAAGGPTLGTPETPIANPDVPEETPTATPTATPTETPTPVPPKCEYHQITAEFIREDDSSNARHGKAMFTMSKGTHEQLYSLPCIRAIFDRCYVPQGQGPISIGYERFRDDCVFLELSKIWAASKGHRSDYCGTMSAAAMNCARSDNRCKSVPNQVNGKCQKKPLTVVVDALCNWVASATEAQICTKSKALGYYTPISLIWTPGTDIESVYNVVEFKQNPYQPARWHSWRGSSVTPLLVFDPDHRGEIVSGAQLFGEWTWGGKKQASLDDRAAGSAAPQWAHGYDALAQLDSNQNGKIDGAELAPLGLWFDNNRDAVSQPGEVISAQDAALTALYFRSEAYDPLTKTRRAAVGFERIVDGAVVQGESVDWYGETAASKLEMLQREQARLGALPIANTDSEEAAPIAAAHPAAVTFEGAWKWHLEGEQAKSEAAVTAGVLHLAYNEESGRFQGGTFVQLPLENREGVQHAALTRVPIDGRIHDVDGKAVLKFRTIDQNFELAVSSATLSEDGKTLSGESVARIAKGGSPGEFTTVTYRWVAERY